MIFEITPDDDLDVTVIRRVSDAVVYGRQSKPHIVDIKKTVTGIFAVYDLDG
jgi:hypothetical protein